ncbi:unnamed protein product, partial [Polarella glacialis]
MSDADDERPVGLSEKAQISPVSQLADIRRTHQERFEEREEVREKAEEVREQARRDKELADELAKEKEEARLKQLDADEEYSRILAAQLNPGGSQQMQDFGTSHMPTDDADGELAAHYQQLEDGEAEGYRAPMRTGYVDRLIPEGGPSDIDNRPHRTFQSDMERLWLMLQVASAHR